jgi:hypothetical protein
LFSDANDSFLHTVSSAEKAVLDADELHVLTDGLLPRRNHMIPRMADRPGHDRAAAAIWLHEKPDGLEVRTKTLILGFSVILIGSSLDPVAGPARARGATATARAIWGSRWIFSMYRSLVFWLAPL